MELHYPKDLGIGTSGLGLSTCRAGMLIGYGPKGCPSTSVMGYGTGRVEVPFEEGNVSEAVRLTTFMAPLHEGHLALLFYVDAERPIAAELVFHGTVLPANAPFGGDLATVVPIVPTLPGASDAILSQFSTTIGPEHITYWEYSTPPLHPIPPKRHPATQAMPPDGFPFAASFTFANGTYASARTVVPCPHADVRADR